LPFSGSNSLGGGSSVPYTSLPAVNFLNNISLQVRVPVLSEKIYETYPSSSFKFDAYARAGAS